MTRPPSIYRKRLGTRLTPEMSRRLAVTAALRDQTVQELLDSILDAHLPAADQLAAEVRSEITGTKAEVFALAAARDGATER